MRIVAVIPARGGSRRIPRKNIKLFYGEPIISYPIRLALGCGIFDSVVVSSEDDEILTVAKEYGAIPLMRPQELALDQTPTLSVISHSVSTLGLDPGDLVCCIYPTTPLLESIYLHQALSCLRNAPQKNYAFSVSEFDSSPFRGFSISHHTISMLFPQYQLSCSQSLEKIYHDAGAFYFGFAQSFSEERLIFSPDSIPIVLPQMIVQDINTIDDWNLAEIKYQLKTAQTL